MSLDDSPEAPFNDLARLAAIACGTAIGAFGLVDEERVYFKARVGLAAPLCPRRGSFCSWAILSTQVMVVPDAGRDERFAGTPALDADPPVLFYAGAPLVAPDGNVVGTLCVMDHRPRQLSPSERAALEALARQGAALLSLRAQAIRAEESARALERANAELAGERARLKAILDTAAEGIITIDGRGLVESFNGAAERIFGYASAEVLGRDVSMLMPEPDRSRHGLYLSRFLETGEAKIIGIGRETVGRRKDGSTFPMFLAVSELALGDARLFTGFVRDISQLKAAERLKDEFVSMASHELRSPLTSIRGSLGLLESQALGALAPQARELVGIARSNTERLIRLISDVLDLEKIEAGKVDLKLQPLDPRELLETAAAGLRGLAAEAGVDFEIAPGAPARLLGDRDRLIQVLTNLASNAVRYSPPGARVALGARASPGGRTRFEVVDRGPGIAAEAQLRLFGRFQQLGSSARERGGSGLGLAISKALVEQHGGRVGVESQVGHGSTFFFELPGAPPVAPSERDPSGRPVALLLEGDEDLALSLASALTGAGFAVDRAGTAREALEKLERALPEVLVAGPLLPDGNALAVIERLRLRPEAQEVPAVVLAGPRPLLVEWIAEPFEKQRLARAVRRAVRRPGAPLARLVGAGGQARAARAASLRAVGAECLEAAPASLAAPPPDLVVLDADVPVEGGFERLGLGGAPPAALVVLAGGGLTAAQRSALALGLARHLGAERASPEELAGAVRELLRGLFPEVSGR